MRKKVAHCYIPNPSFFVAVDCIVLGYDGTDLKILLIKRNFEPEKGKWSLMGGFLKENESLFDAAERVLYQLTGLKNVYLEQLYAFGDIDRDSADRVISVAYYALINIRDFNGPTNAKYSGVWHDLKDVPELIFDHNAMVKRALRRIRRKTKTQPIGFELLPEKFTFPQLLNLYEKIYDRQLDKRNFRKKVLTLNVLDKLEEKDRVNSRKGAFLYTFNKTKYDTLLLNGFVFDVFTN